MDITLQPGPLSGSIAAIPSKSQAHRMLICAAFAGEKTELICPETNQDIEATADCLRALGADIQRAAEGYFVTPISVFPKNAELFCRESGSTLRFFLPIIGAMGVDALLHMEGRLPQRPLSPLWEEMERMGCALSRPTEDTIRCTGKLRPGEYSIQGGVSSQFVTGLLYGLSLLNQGSRLALTGNVESLPYINMTIAAMERFGVNIPHSVAEYQISPARFRSPGKLTVEGDWSNGAFWLAAKALGSPITVTGLDPDSPQGDRAMLEWLNQLDSFQTIDASQIPDLVPILAVVAGAKSGAVFVNAGRLRIKETDRLKTTADLIRNLEGKAEIDGDTLTVEGTGYSGGIVDATGDHRIAMAAAIAATVCPYPVTIHGAEAVNKSYPAFWRDYGILGGKL